MKLRKSRLVALLVIVILAITCIPFERVSAADTIKLSKTKVTIEQGQEVTIKLEGISTKAKVKWSVSKKTIVTLENKKKAECKIIADKVGVTNVKAKYDGKTYKCKVTVVKSSGEKETGKNVKTAISIYSWDANKYFDVEGTYTGETKSGIPNGSGVFTAINSAEETYTVEADFVNGRLDGSISIKWYDDADMIGEQIALYQNGVFLSASETFDDDEYSYTIYNADDNLYVVIYSEEESYVYHTTFGDGSVASVQGADTIYNMGFAAITDSLSLKELNYINSTLKQTKTKVKKAATYIEPKKYKKSPSKYENCIDVIEKAYVFDCKEYDTGYTDVPTITHIYCTDANEQIYVLFYPDSLDIYEGDYIDIWFTLTGKYEYESIGKNTIQSFAGIAYIAEISK